jgi:hypothetical protein
MRLTVSPQTNTGQLGHFSKNQLKFNKLTPPAANTVQLPLVLPIRRNFVHHVHLLAADTHKMADCAVLSSVACPALHYFSKLSLKWHHFRKTFSERKMRGLIFTTTLSEIFHTTRRIQRDVVINVRRSSCEVPVVESDFKEKLNISIDFRKIFGYQTPRKSV